MYNKNIDKLLLLWYASKQIIHFCMFNKMNNGTRRQRSSHGLYVMDLKKGEGLINRNKNYER